MKIDWIDHGREPQCPPNPLYPNGIDIRVEETKGDLSICRADLPYPAPRCGVWRVTCEECGQIVGVTAAGRADDPKSLEMVCMGKAKRKDRAESKINTMLRRAAREICDGVANGELTSDGVIANLRGIFDAGVHLGASVKLGETGAYPAGQLDDSDEGGLQIAVGVRPDHPETVILQFGKTISWIGLERPQAIDVAMAIMKHAGFEVEHVPDAKVTH